MRQVYKERRAALIENLAVEFPAERGFEIHGSEAGMHLAMTLPEGFRDVEISVRAARERLWLWPLSPSYLSDKPRQGFVLGFGSTTAEQMARAVRLMGSVVSGDSSHGVSSG